MNKDLDDYIINKLREGKKVNIEIIGRKEEDWLNMDWIIDKKFILKDMPFEIFEGEELKMMGCGKKFEFVEADNVYVAICTEEELCPKCFSKPSEAKE